RRLRDFDAIAFALSYEQDYLNILRMLDASGIPRRAHDRRTGDPLLIAGGPALWGNPEPVAPFFDAIVIGDGEEAIGEIARCLGEHSGASRPELLAALSRIAGVYVPARYEPVYSSEGYYEGLDPLGDAPPFIERLWVREIDRHPAQSAVLTPHTEFADTFLIEIARGCSRACRFCMAGFITRPVRYRQLPHLVEQVEQGLQFTSKIGLLSASVSDHPDLLALGEHLRTRQVRLYMSSIRADAITPDFIALLRHGGLKSLTVAPEAGSERMRTRISKHLTHQELLQCVRYAGEGGMTGIKYYVMVGLPHEEDDDIRAIVDLMADTVRVGRPLGLRQFVIDLHPFVPKAFTPYQWEPQADLSRFERIFDMLRGPLAKLGVQTRFDSPAWAIVQEPLARGDRRVADVIERALTMGGNLSAYRRAVKETPIPRRFFSGSALPWDHLASGMSHKFLVLESLKAAKDLQSPACPIDAQLAVATPGCTRCGVCEDLPPVRQPAVALL
ncbi:MAG: radical SAM protein, partial [Cyanobacteria bacterium REEB65]|nr:radical SAM protein [Cyanobacteria bacterium REEB65]